MVFFMLYNIVFIKVLVYLSSATCTMNLQNPKNGSKLPSRDFANPPKRYRQFPYSKTELFLAANEEIFTILNNQMVKN